jgi:hypothetical protein
MNYDFVNTQLVIKDGKAAVTSSQEENEIDNKQKTISNENFSLTPTSVSPSSVRQQDYEDSALQVDLNKKFKMFNIEEYSNSERSICQVIEIRKINYTLILMRM